MQNSRTVRLCYQKVSLTLCGLTWLLVSQRRLVCGQYIPTLISKAWERVLALQWGAGFVL